MTTYLSEHEGTKHRILSAAKKEFAEKGFTGARMSSIARAAGVNQALIHYYFSSKINIYINIFRQLMGNHFEKYVTMFNDEFESWNAAPDIKLCGMLYAMVNGHLNVHDEDLHRIILHEIAAGKGVIYGLINHYLQPQITNLEKVIREGIELGMFETSDPVLLIIKYISFLNHLSLWAEFLQEPDKHEELYPSRSIILYDFITELAFKELCPPAMQLKIPVLDIDKKNRINALLEKMKNEINTY